MTRTTYPATWPGTCVIRSVHTPGAKAVMSKAQALPTPKPMHLTRAPAQAGNPRHNGAYSRAGTTGGDAKIHKPAKARKVAA